MVQKHFHISPRNGHYIAGILQGEEHLNQDLELETRTSGYTLSVSKSELISEVTKAVESYINAFDKSTNCVNSENLTLKIHLILNQ